MKLGDKVYIVLFNSLVRKIMKKSTSIAKMSTKVTSGHFLHSLYIVPVPFIKLLKVGI